MACSCAPAQGNDGAGGQFLACPAFAPNQDINVACCDLLDCVVDKPHRFAGTNEILKPAGFHHLLT